MVNDCPKCCGDVGKAWHQHRNKSRRLCCGNEVFRKSFKEKVILSWVL